MTRRGPLRTDGGFTLIELMVALAVFGLAALTLLRMEALSVQQTADLDRRFGKEMVAQNLAVEMLTDPQPPALGQSSGEAETLGRRFAWTAETAPMPDGPGLLRIRISVSEGEGQAVTLDIVRARP